jgi:hypothetical protein
MSVAATPADGVPGSTAKQPPTYRQFLSGFVVGNVVVWAIILAGFAHFVAYKCFHSEGVVAPTTGLFYLLIMTAIVTVLATHSTVVGLAKQELDGKFRSHDLPTGATSARGVPPNPWTNAVAALAFWPIAAAAALVICRVFAPSGFTHGRMIAIGAAAGAVAVLVAVLLPGATAYRRSRGTRPPYPPQRDTGYMIRHFFVPWALVNGVINGLLGYSSYAVHDGWPRAAATLGVFLPDVFGTAFVTSLCMIFSAGPHAMLDVQRGRVAHPAPSPSLPGLGRRIGLFAAFALAATVVTLLALRVFAVEEAALPLIVAIKVFVGGLAGGVAAWATAEWAIRHASHLHAPATTPAPVGAENPR